MSSTDQAFYSTGAQVLPILLLAGWFELRLMHRLPVPKRWSGEWIWYCVVGTGIGAVIVGEIVALVALATGHAKTGDKAWVINGLIAGGVAVYIGLMASTQSELGKDDPRRDLLRLVAVAVPLAVIGTVLTR
jgi:hypothetical protein